MRMIIFDLDGTLWDSSESVVASWNMEVKRITGIDPQITPDGMRRNMGKTMNDIADDVFQMFPLEQRYELARRCEVFENEYIAEHGGVLFEGVRETLQQLYEAGVPMAIVSNCQEGYIPAFLQSMEMEQYFLDYEEWGRSGLQKADNIRMVMRRNGAERAVYVGDIQKDADAAAAAGVPCIWAAYGFGQIEAPAAVLSSFAELPQVLQSLGFEWPEAQAAAN